MAQKVFLGTELKLNINIESIGGFNMKDYDFVVELYCNSLRPKKVVINKESAREVDESNYVVCVDTNELGAGKLECKVIAYVPDGDFRDGKRTEVAKLNTGIEIV